MQGRLTLGLYNSYGAKFHEVHRRAVTRALALCTGFDCNLALFGFPVPEETRTPREISEFLADKTTISTREDLLKLASEGRFHLFPFPERGFPPQLGLVVVTTQHPDRNKAVGPEFIVSALLGGKSVCLVFGLGHRGLGKVEEIAEYHFEVTGKGVGLETCTALGAVVGVVWATLKCLRRA
ncbi:MAG: DUF531 domain-containing protein [Thermoplasmata archaeon]|nr:DUF531 domain-containing protein [Thermoplasmata archaeon]